MKSKKTVRRQTINERRQVAIRLGEGNGAAQICNRCGNDSLMFLPEIVSVILRIPTREIYRRIEAGNIHFFENNENQVLVCVRSFDQRADETPPRIEANANAEVTKRLSGWAQSASYFNKRKKGK